MCRADLFLDAPFFAPRDVSVPGAIQCRRIEGVDFATLTRAQLAALLELIGLGKTFFPVP